MDIQFAQLLETDVAPLAAAFVAQGWGDRTKTFQKYLNELDTGARHTIIAKQGDDYVGYITIMWQPHYPPFVTNNIPEIADFNVLIAHRGKGYGRALLAEAERRISERSTIAGLGVALLPDYGEAQKMYVKSGYIPDGRGITYNYNHSTYGDAVKVDDDLVLWFTKTLRG